jgi:Ni/Co efflux regulator RcnB
LRIFATLALILCLGLTGFAAQRKHRRSAIRKTTQTAVSKPVRHGKAVVRSASARRRTQSKSKGRARSSAVVAKCQTWRGGQMTPSPQRYGEIQQALVTKGYTSQSPDGVWGPEWTGSLKRFQQDQKLEPNGKLTALSLITLGLGPRRESGASPASAVPPGSALSQSPEPVLRGPQ